MSDTVSRLHQEAEEAKRVWTPRVKDITQDFTTASNKLEGGQLVKDEWFTLFESVGALEIMDPKMDSGYVPPDDTFEADFDPVRPLDLPEVLWVIDQIHSLEILWHAGYPLSQTVFTSLHMDRILDPQQPRMPSLYLHAADKEVNAALTEEQSLGHALLTAYCVAVAKCCALVVELVQSQNYYEEEDFVTHMFGRELLPRVSLEEALELVDAATSRLRKSKTVDAEMKEALQQRMIFRTTFLCALADGGDESRWERMVGLLGRIKTSHEIAKPLPEAFSEKVQRQLATSTPPRPMLTTSWDEACKKWTKMIEDVVAVNRLTDINIVQSPASLQRAMWAFSYRGEPFALPRAIIQDCLFGDQAIRGQIPQYDLLLADIRDLVLAGDPIADPASFQVEVTTDPRHICSRLMEGFMDKAIEEYLNFYRMVCQNRCRIRRLFTQSIAILDAMEMEAMKVDRELIKSSPGLKLNDPKSGRAVSLSPLSSWAKFYRLRILAWTIQLGFETEIYLPYELAGMYWFLSRLSEQRNDLIQQVLLFTVGRAKRLGKDRNALADCLLSEQYLQSLHAMYEITRLLAEALWKLFTLLTSTGVVKKPKQDFTTQQLLYEARMKPYLCLTNDTVPSADDFALATTQNASLEQTCTDIDDCIKSAKELLVKARKLTPEQAKFVGTDEEWKREVKGLEATCIAVTVACSQVRSAGKKYGEDHLAKRLECKIERRWAEWWVVPSVKVKADTKP
ncbi:N-alpha-acetyltransferase, non-catalitic subunit [Saxophila tyrrhenica]|uniref:N-alpha-acetyltransferase, non-catalitic subunit n=1 Tax=Saxophila tyrrhenica TaxID=1690608 RepID=A0AAV9PGN3_9PEZI|nr:N-alpha-acetyltransferase, non-catalitic subunit [Saxophila tyrrhenica]